MENYSRLSLLNKQPSRSIFFFLRKNSTIPSHTYLTELKRLNVNYYLPQRVKRTFFTNLMQHDFEWFIFIKQKYKIHKSATKSEKKSDKVLKEKLHRTRLGYKQK